jgi:hypothetical protein
MCQCPTCREAAEAAQRDRDDAEMTRFAVAWIAERYGLDDTDAALHLHRHAINGTGVIQ